MAMSRLHSDPLKQNPAKWNDVKLTAKLKGAAKMPATVIPGSFGRDLPSSRGQTILMLGKHIEILYSCN